MKLLRACFFCLQARIEEVRVQLAEAEAGTDCSQLEQELGTREVRTGLQCVIG